MEGRATAGSTGDDGPAPGAARPRRPSPTSAASPPSTASAPSASCSSCSSTAGSRGPAAGFFGVDVFFVLSGFLITGLLVSEYRQNGGIGLARFWGHRVRRLVPALLVMLAGVALYGRVPGPAGHPRPAAGRRAGHAPLRQQLAPGHRRPGLLRRPRTRRGRCSTPGRSRSRSSSTWCGRSWSWASCGGAGRCAPCWSSPWPVRWPARWPWPSCSATARARAAPTTGPTPGPRPC